MGSYFYTEKYLSHHQLQTLTNKKNTVKGCIFCLSIFGALCIFSVVSSRRTFSVHFFPLKSSKEFYFAKLVDYITKQM